MAKKAKIDRTDPRKNKSLAIRTVLAKMPKAKAAEIAEAVKSEYGHNVSTTLVYLVKSKANIKAGRRGKPKGQAVAAAPSSAAAWVESIRLARRLLQATGSVDNAVAILKAVEG
jgi:hypothetical protein